MALPIVGGREKIVSDSIRERAETLRIRLPYLSTKDGVAAIEEALRAQVKDMSVARRELQAERDRALGEAEDVCQAFAARRDEDTQAPTNEAEEDRDARFMDLARRGAALLLGGKIRALKGDGK